MKRRKGPQIRRGRNLRQGVKKRHDVTDDEEDDPEENELLMDGRCRSLEDLRDVKNEEFPPLKPYFGGTSLRKAKSLDDILLETRQEVEEVKTVMYNNMVKIRDRNGKLEDLLDKSKELTASCEDFMLVGKQIKRKQCLRAWKYRILLFVGLAVLLIVLTIILALVLTENNDNHYHEKVTNRTTK